MLTSVSASRTEGGLRRCRLMLVNVSCYWVICFVPNLYRGTGAEILGQNPPRGSRASVPRGRLGRRRPGYSWTEEI